MPRLVRFPFWSIIYLIRIFIFWYSTPHLQWSMQGVEHELEVTARLQGICSEYERQMEE